MNNPLPSRRLQRHLIRFLAIVGFAMMASALILGLRGEEDTGYTAADLRATASALDVRATEFARSTPPETPPQDASTRSATTSQSTTARQEDGSTDEASAEPAQSTIGSRSLPVPVGEPFGTRDSLMITLLSADYDAWPLVQAANSFNQPPVQGLRMVMTNIQVQNLDDNAVASPRTIRSADFRMVGSKNVVYTPFGSDTRCGVVPNELNWDTFAGATVSGNICIKLPEDDQDLLLIYAPGRWRDSAYYFLLPSAP
jgi:hypothetical protein